MKQILTALVTVALGISNFAFATTCTSSSSAYDKCICAANSPNCVPNSSGYTNYSNGTYKHKGDLENGNHPRGFTGYHYDSCKKVAYQGVYFWTECEIDSNINRESYCNGGIPGNNLHCKNTKNEVS